jgi:protein phosphatase PTC7
MRSAASAAAKKLRPMQLISGHSMIPHPKKANRGGEDAYFISPRAVGVADGVGGWAARGVDPGIYARGLCSYAKDYAQTTGSVDPVEILRTAYDANARDEAKGSSTACFIAIDGNSLHAANLGDSGFLVIREREVVFRSPAQVHGFNFPFQLGPTSQDMPESCDRHEVEVEENDVIVTATDGIFDNMYDSDIVEIVATKQPQMAAIAIAGKASRLAHDRNYVSPFSREARKFGYEDVGGKLDDMTVIVSRVCEVPQPSL